MSAKVRQLVFLAAASTLPFSAQAFLDSLLQVGQAAAGVAQATGQVQPQAQAQAMNALSATCVPRPGLVCPKSTMMQTRAPAQLDKLLSGQPISGADLMTEIRGLRSAMATHNLNNAMQTMMGMANSPVALTSPSSGGFFGSLFGAASDALLDMLVSEMSYQALDYFFGQMAEQPDLLKEVSVTLPKAEAHWTPEMKQQIVNMGTFLVAIKGSGKIIDASEKDFEAATESYRKVLEARTTAAKVLGEAFYSREGLFASEKEAQARGQQYLTAADREYLETLRDKKPEDFMKDFQAQNIALSYLSKINPKEYGNYRLSVGEFKNHYGAYAKTSVGAASMLGFSSMFIKRAKNLVEKNGLASAAPLMSLATDGLGEITTLAPRVYKTMSRSPDTQDGSFSVRLPGNELKRGLSADKVFATLEDKAKGNFREGLFRNGKAGYFGQLGEKYPQMAGQMLDSLVEKDNRKAFVKGYLQEEDMPDFSFQNVLTEKGPKNRELKSALFRSSPTVSSVQEDEKSIALVQKDVREKLTKWDNSALRRVLFANRSANLPDGQMLVDGYAIAVDSPGMKGIMDYEEMAVAGAEHAVLRKTEAAEPKAATTGKKKK
jgi:hypothetical protein